VQLQLAEDRNRQFTLSLAVSQEENKALHDQQTHLRHTNAELNLRLKAQDEDTLQLQGKHDEVLLRVEQLNTDLLAAEGQLHSHSTDLRQQQQQLDQLSQRNQELQSSLRLSQQALKERDQLISKLQSEVAEGAAVLGGIQHRLGNLGDAAEMPLDKVAPSRLLMRMEDGTEIVHLLGKNTVIGRDHDCQLRLQARYISRHHAVVSVSPQGATIEDLNSTNGVFVNGTRIKRSALVDGDEIIVGKTPFRLLSRPVLSAH
jgi:hypothetical protein